MIVILEVSRPFQWRPFTHTSNVNLRFGWLCFAISIYPMREDELLAKVQNGDIVWEVE